MVNRSNELNCRYCNLIFKNIFKKLTAEQMEYLNSFKDCIHVGKGKLLYEQGQRITGIYCINSGILKIYKTGIEGKEQIIKFAKQGDVIGYRSVINNEAACTSVRALKDSTLCFIPTNDFFKLLKENAEFAIEMLHIACAELDESNSYLTDIAQKSVKERLAEILLKLKDEFGVDNENMISINLSRVELANIIGTATESVIRLLSDFKNEGLIEIQGRKIKLSNESALKKICNHYQ